MKLKHKDEKCPTQVFKWIKPDGVHWKDTYCSIKPLQTLEREQYDVWLSHSPLRSQLWSEGFFLNSTYKFCGKSQERKLPEDTFKRGRKQFSDFLVSWVWRWISRCAHMWILPLFGRVNKTQSSGVNISRVFLCTCLKHTQMYGSTNSQFTCMLLYSSHLFLIRSCINVQSERRQRTTTRNLLSANPSATCVTPMLQQMHLSNTGSDDVSARLHTRIHVQTHATRPAYLCLTLPAVRLWWKKADEWPNNKVFSLPHHTSSIRHRSRPDVNQQL